MKKIFKTLAIDTLSALISAVIGVVVTAAAPRAWSEFLGPRLLYVEAQNTGDTSAAGRQAVVTVFNVSGRTLKDVKVRLAPKAWPTAISLSASGNNDFLLNQGEGAASAAAGVVTLSIVRFPEDSKFSVFVSSAEEFRLGGDTDRVSAIEGSDDLTVAKLRSELVRTPFDPWAYGLGGLLGGVAGMLALGWIRSLGKSAIPAAAQ